ncbi:MAG: nucleotidyltransferase domain-containing protein [Synergistaceae bacterium]|nr:nucleotidyltransferase domain-containing protein [Synergistaceae bacterium]
MTETELEELKKIVAPIAEKRGVEKVYLFGSRARGDNRPDSDYDFFVHRGTLKGLAYFGLIGDLEDALVTSVDIVLNGIPEESRFMREVKTDEVLVYDNAAR